MSCNLLRRSRINPLFLSIHELLGPDQRRKNISIQKQPALMHPARNRHSQKNRSSHRRRSVKNGVLKNFVKLTGKHLCQSLFFNKGLSLELYLSHASVSVILLSMQVIITSTQCVIGLLICGNSSSWLPNLNLIYETPQSGEGSGLLSTKLRKLNTEAAFQRCSFKKVFWKYAANL